MNRIHLRINCTIFGAKKLNINIYQTKWNWLYMCSKKPNIKICLKSFSPFFGSQKIKWSSSGRSSSKSVDIRLQKIAFICVSALISAHFLQHHYLLQQFSSIAPVVSNKILYIRIKRHNGERSRHFYGTMGPLQIVILSNVYGLFYYLTECHERFSSAPFGTCDTRIERLLLNSAPGGVKASKWEKNMLRFEIDLICKCHVPKKKIM